MPKGQHGRQACGENHGSAKLSEAQARYAWRSKTSSEELAQVYGVSERAILDIREGRRWKHLRGAAQSMNGAILVAYLAIAAVALAVVVLPI